MPEAPVFDCLFDFLWLKSSTEVLENNDSMSFSAVDSADDGSTAIADTWDVILGFGILGFKKLVILIELKLWRRVRIIGLWGLRRGGPLRKVER